MNIIKYKEEIKEAMINKLIHEKELSYEKSLETKNENKIEELTQSIKNLSDQMKQYHKEIQDTSKVYEFKVEIGPYDQKALVIDTFYYTDIDLKINTSNDHPNSYINEKKYHDLVHDYSISAFYALAPDFKIKSIKRIK